MWIRLPKQNASKSAPSSRLTSWIWRLKLVAFAGCVVWVAAQFSSRTLSQEPSPFPALQPQWNAPANSSLSTAIAQESMPASLQNAPLPYPPNNSSPGNSSPGTQHYAPGTQPLPGGTPGTGALGTGALGTQQQDAGTQPFPQGSAIGTQQQPLRQEAAGTQPAPAQPIPATPAPRDIGMRILHRTLLESVWGPPTMCDVRQSIQIVDKKRSSFGKYVRTPPGQGSGRMRMTLQVPAADQMNSLLQVSDGELLTTYESIGTHSMMTQVDLGKVRERLNITNKETIQDPVIAMYLAIGGQAEVLRKICQKYDWTKVTEGQLGDQKVWWIRGISTAEPVGPVAKATVDIRLFDQTAPMVIWPNVKLAIGHVDSKAPFWLYQVETWSDGDSEGRGKTYVMTEWDAPVRLKPQQLTQDLFQLGTNHSASEVRDETKLYLPPSSSSNMATQPQPLQDALRLLR